MPYRSKSDESSMDKDGNNESIMDSDFIPLDDLVYAPLYAIAKSNQQLRADILQSIRAMGTSKQNGQEEVIHMNNINIAYDQIRPEGDDGYSVDNLQVQVPLLSMVPVTNLGVDKAEINFSTEVKAVDNPNTGERKINARICSPSQRESDFLPKISYKLQVSSIPATEGILRLTDALSSSQVATKIGSTPIAISGDFGTDEQKNIIQKIKVLKAKIGKLNQLHQKISEMIDEQERLHQLSKDSFEEDTYEFDRDKYKMAQSNIINRIMEYKEEIMNMEISYGLDKDYE